ncbi:hypothetical protein Syun_017482 [Stephania yunnanensis]|uniref:Uncharacterized protein n=1 Tax=Stephania yunnanensis TaxID=152371 RepID=A0AAP0J8N5_9MAGN
MPYLYQGAALLVPRRNLARAKGVRQGITLLVPKEPAKARPCSCQRARRSLAFAKGIYQGATLLMPRRGLAHDKGRARARAKVQPRLRSSTVPRGVLRRDLVHACALPHPSRMQPNLMEPSESSETRLFARFLAAQPSLLGSCY